MGKFIVLLAIIAIIVIVAILSIFMPLPSASETMKFNYDHDANTPFYMYKNLHTKTKALHHLYPQLHVMPEVKMSSEIIPVLKEAGKCSNQLCDILMSESSNKRKK